MAQKAETILAALITRWQKLLLEEWLAQQAGMAGSGAITADTDTKEYCTRFLAELRAGLAAGEVADIRGSGWSGMRELLEEVSRSRVAKGFTPSETASFVFSLKGPLFALLRRETGNNAGRLGGELDGVGAPRQARPLHHRGVSEEPRGGHHRASRRRCSSCRRRSCSSGRASLALPLIGTLDSARTQVVMENLLQQIVSSGAEIAIIDITGVPTVDTLVAQHLLKTVSAARLMGADCIISGIRPQIAQTIVHLGVELSVTSKATHGRCASSSRCSRIGKMVVERRPRPRR